MESVRADVVPASRRSRRIILMLGFMLSISFAFIMITLINYNSFRGVVLAERSQVSIDIPRPISPDGVPASSAVPQVNAVPDGSVEEVADDSTDSDGFFRSIWSQIWPYVRIFFFERSSLFCFEAILAGMLGAYLRQITSLQPTKEAPEKNSDVQKMLIEMFFGAAAAVMVAIIFPLIVVAPMRVGYPYSWTLVAVAGLIGYNANLLFWNTSAKISELAEAIQNNQSSAHIAEAVREEIGQALSLPPSIKYRGVIMVGISNVSAGLEENQKEIFANKDYVVSLKFTTKPSIPNSVDTKHTTRGIIIDSGLDKQIVPFKIVVDYGFIEIPPAEKYVDVPSKGDSSQFEFRFSVPKDAWNEFALNPIAASADMETQTAIRDMNKEHEIVVYVYQHAKFIESIPINMNLNQEYKLAL